MYRGWTVTELGTGRCREGRPTLGLLFTHSKDCMTSAGRGHHWSSEDFTLHHSPSELVHLLIDRCVCRTLK